MKSTFTRAWFPACTMLALLSACQTPAPAPGPTSSTSPSSIPSATTGSPPADLLSAPDAVPRAEPISKLGNPAFYDVLGQRYFVKSSAVGYVERGVASWYGPGFHKEKTSNGEPYDMYAMTAAHKTLPLPAYVQVTNLANGKQVVLRVNDRGPFKEGRIIDLSYTAAAKLDMLRAGTALVEVRALTPGEAAAAPPALRPLYVQAGAFGEAANAERLASQLRNAGHAQATVRADMVNGRTFHRVRIGPVADVAAFDRVVSQLKQLGIHDARLAGE